MNKTKAQVNKTNPEMTKEMKAFLDMFNPKRITGDELIRGVELMLAHVKEIKANNSTELTAIKTALQNVLTKMQSDSEIRHEKTSTELRKLFDTALKEIRSHNTTFGSDIEKKVSQTLEDFHGEINSAFSEYEFSISEMREELSNIPEKDSPEQIVEKLESLIPESNEEEDKRLDARAIKGLKKLIKKVVSGMGGNSGGGGSERRGVQYYDLSSQLDGVTKTFSLPAFLKVLDVKLSSVPVMRQTTDYTQDGTLMKITFTSEINAATDLSSGQSCIVLYSEA